MRERNIDELPVAHTLTRDQARNLGRCLDQGWNWRPVDFWDDAQPPELYWSRCLPGFLETVGGSSEPTDLQVVSQGKPWVWPQHLLTSFHSLSELWFGPEPQPLDIQGSWEKERSNKSSGFEPLTIERG